MVIGYKYTKQEEMKLQNRMEIDEIKGNQSETFVEKEKTASDDQLFKVVKFNAKESSGTGKLANSKGDVY